MKKTESFAVISNIDTAKEKVIFTFSVINDDMNQTSRVELSDVLELLNHLIDRDPVQAVSIGITEEKGDG